MRPGHGKGASRHFRHPKKELFGDFGDLKKGECRKPNTENLSKPVKERGDKLVKIEISYETPSERMQIMELIDPVLRNAKIKENQNSERYNRIYISYQADKSKNA